MKSPQSRVNAKAARRDAKDDAIELATFFAKGAGVLLLTFALFSIFDSVVELAEQTSIEILSPISGD